MADQAGGAYQAVLNLSTIVFDSFRSQRSVSLMNVTSEQFRAARALLRLDQDDVARRASVSPVTIRRLESQDGTRQVAADTVAEVRRALEAAGAEFIEYGVRRRAAMPTDEALLAGLIAISRRSAARLGGQPLLTDADLYDEDCLPH